MDLIYLRNDGGIIPCEIKITGKSFDTHGQLIRYIADLSEKQPDYEWLIKTHGKFNKKYHDKSTIKINEIALKRFLKNQSILQKDIKFVNKTGIIIDVDFKPQVLQAVKYLNNTCDWSIRLIQIITYTEQNTKPTDKEIFARIDFVDISV